MNATLAHPRLAAYGLLLLLGLTSLWSLFAYWGLQTDRPRASLSAHSDLELHRSRFLPHIPLPLAPPPHPLKFGRPKSP